MSEFFLWIIAIEFFAVAVSAAIHGTFWLVLYGVSAALIQISIIGGMK